MTLNEYQTAALQTARDPRAKDEFLHRVLGLVGEAGEIAEKVKKLIRDQGGDLSKLDAQDIQKELGDVLWYTAALASFLGIELEAVGQTNIAKLASRLSRGQLGGSGDNR